MTTSNRYSPPKAEVEGVKGPRPQARPFEIKMAMWLIASSAALCLLGLLLRGVQGTAGSPLALIFLVGLGVALWKRQNWARIVFVILYALQLPNFFFASRLIAEAGAASFVIFCIQALLESGVIWFVICKPSATWFRPQAQSDA